MDNTNDIEIIRGTSKTIKISLTDANGVDYTLKDGERLLFGVKKTLDDKECIICKVITAKTNGVYAVKLMPCDTAKLENGTYNYDIGLESGDDFYNVIPPNAFIIEPNVVKYGEGV